MLQKRSVGVQLDVGYVVVILSRDVKYSARRVLGTPFMGHAVCRDTKIYYMQT